MFCAAYNPIRLSYPHVLPKLLRQYSSFLRPSLCFSLWQSNLRTISSDFTTDATFPIVLSSNCQGNKDTSPQNTKPRHMNRRSRPRMVICQGIPGSGKSTFAQRLQDEYGWVRVCQDVLGNRHRCVQHARQSLISGRDVVIDRCNFDRSQRRHWVDIVYEQGIFVGCVLFATPFAICLQRVNAREDHETLNASDPMRNEGVLKDMANNVQLPKADEGIDFCRVIRNERDFERVLKEIASG